MTLAVLGAAPYLVGIGLLVAAPARAEGQRPVEIDALTASPENFTRLLENDHVRVLEYVLEPGQQDLPHTHPPKASYVLSGGMFEVHPDGATTFVVNESTGETSWSGFLGKHYVKNPGTSTVRVLLVEDKPASGVAAPPQPSVAPTLGQPITAKNHKILLENAFVRVVAVTVAAKETEAVPHHSWRSVLYVVEGGDFIDRNASGAVTFDSRTLAKVSTLPPTVWEEPKAPHSIENRSQTRPLKLVRFEFKK